DPALVRPGRCFDILDMPRLTYAQAYSIWVDSYNLDPEGFYALFGERDQVSQAWLMSEIKTATDSLPRNYISNQEISVRANYLE
ncbi:MAG TPA: hypothetical protein VKA48_00300, partial [Gammaproteobacteria bacterium]|nr:hypothetical protein [Gammaproteobacteria bacterium]